METSENTSHHSALFAWLWAAALLSHQIHFRDAFQSAVDVALTGAALFALLNPYSPRRFLALAGFHVAAVVQHAPDVFNHWFFAGLISFAYVLTAAAYQVRRQPLHSGAFAAVARLNLVCLYYFSALHKLNTDYFNLQVGCGAKTYRQLVQALPFLPDSHGALLWATYLSVAVELTLPTLLVTRRWRRPAVALGLFFHLCLGLMGYARFSVIAFALLVLFVPELAAVLPRFAIALGQLRPIQSVPAWISTHKVPIAALWFAAGIAVPYALGPYVWFTARIASLAGLLTYLLFLASGVTLLAAALHLSPRQDRASRPRPFAPATSAGRVSFATGLPASTTGLPASATGLLSTAPGLLSTALIVLSGFAPYLGLHTLNTFAMYSNLRTENATSNHFFITPGVQIFPYQRDMVELRESNVGALDRLVQTGMLIPYQQLRVEILRAMARGRKAIRLAYLRNGQPATITHAERDPELASPMNILALKFMAFRAVEKQGPRACTY